MTTTALLVVSGALSVAAATSAASWPKPLRSGFAARRELADKTNIFLDPTIVFRAVLLLGGIFHFALGLSISSIIMTYQVPDLTLPHVLATLAVGGLAINQAWATWAAALVSKRYGRFNAMLAAWAAWAAFALWWQAS